MNYCNKCGQKLNADQKFCNGCGNDLIKRKNYCNGCGAKLNPGENFCSNCGNNIIAKTNTINSQNKLSCPNCYSDNIHVQIVTEKENTGCFSILLFIILGITCIGIPLMIILLLLTGPNTVNKKYYICQNCGETFPQKQSNNNDAIAILIFIIALFILGFILFIY